MLEAGKGATKEEEIRRETRASPPPPPPPPPQRTMRLSKGHLGTKQVLAREWEGGHYVRHAEDLGGLANYKHIGVVLAIPIRGDKVLHVGNLSLGC